MSVWSSKMPEMSHKDWVRLNVSQTLKLISDTLGGSGGRVEITPSMQKIAMKRAAEARAVLKREGVTDKALVQHAKSIERLAKLPNDALRLYYDMVRSKNQKLRVTESTKREAKWLVDAGHARYSKTAAGTVYIKPPWTENPDPSFELTYGGAPAHEVVFKAGALAFYDTFAGMVPVKVLKVHKPGSGRMATGPGAGSLDVQITATRGAYKKGEILRDLKASSVVPRKMAKSSGFSQKILTAYRWENPSKKKAKRKPKKNPRGKVSNVRSLVAKALK